jgi:hypothetical protein
LLGAFEALMHETELYRSGQPTPTERAMRYASMAQSEKLGRRITRRFSSVGLYFISFLAPCFEGFRVGERNPRLVTNL